MLPWVIANSGATVSEVCERFGYTKTQLVSDLNLVFVCGLPGYGPGDLMDAYIDEDEVVVELADYFSSPLRLTAPEALGLLASGMALVSTGQAPPALHRAVEKLQELVFPEGDEALVVDLREPDLVAQLRTAAADGVVARITYTKLSSGETSDRLVEPWVVFSTMGNWYVSGFCRNADAERVFRVDRIQRLELTDDRFEPPPSVPAPAVDYVPGEDDVYAVIRLGPEAGWVADYYPSELLETDETGARTIRLAVWAAQEALSRAQRSPQHVTGSGPRSSSDTTPIAGADPLVRAGHDPNGLIVE
jgi:predicted DNA-binding transcriptional regulator YafY